MLTNDIVALSHVEGADTGRQARRGSHSCEQVVGSYDFGCNWREYVLCNVTLAEAFSHSFPRLAAFHFDFGALDNSKNEVSEAYDNLFADSQLNPSLWVVFFRAMWKWTPRPLLRLVQYMPTREYKRFRHTRKVVDKVSTVLVDNAIEEAKAVEIEKGKRDVMSVLGELL